MGSLPGSRGGWVVEGVALFSYAVIVVEEFASLEEYCKWRLALDVLLLEIDALYILCGFSRYF